MGVYADLKAQKKTFESPSGLTRFLDSRIALVDPARPTALDARDEVQEVAFVDGASDGTYTVTVRLRNGVTFTTAAIAHDANAATVETALDTASPASVPNGAISVSGGPLDTADLVFTFDGDAVDEEHHPAIVVANSMTDGMDLVGDLTITATYDTTGQTARVAWAALIALGIVEATIPAYGELAPITKGSNLLSIPPWVVREIAQECAAEDVENDVYDAIVTAVFAPGEDTSPLVTN